MLSPYWLRETDKGSYDMDWLISLLVRLLAWFSGLAPVLARLGLVNYGKWDGKEKLRILLVGYNGARNTGADVRVASMTRQLEDVLGKDNVELSIMTMNAENISCYFDSHIHLIPFSTIFFKDLFLACCENHMVILCEGSTLKSKFANALTLFFCEAAGIMKRQNKPCIAYGSEAGEMDPFLERTVKKLCSDTYFIARTQESLDCIQRLGLKGHLGTDTAWSFDSSSHTEWAKEQLRADGWDGVSPLLGVAPINPFWWPVKPSIFQWARVRITKDTRFQFQKWYFFSHSKKKKDQFEVYLDAIADSVNTYAAKTKSYVVILGMERLDADACRKLQSRVAVSTSVFLAGDHNGYEMAAILRQLSMLITSRYHAQILSMGGSVPSVAISMDERLNHIMTELGMNQRQLIEVDDPNLSEKLTDALTYLAGNRESIRENIAERLPDYLKTMNEMASFTAAWIPQQFSKAEISENGHKRCCCNHIKRKERLAL